MGNNCISSKNPRALKPWDKMSKQERKAALEIIREDDASDPADPVPVKYDPVGSDTIEY